jgi:hypothetical protein
MPAEDISLSSQYDRHTHTLRIEIESDISNNVGSVKSFSSALVHSLR